MLPEIIHIPKPKVPISTFLAIPEGGFFTTNNGGLFQKITGNRAMIFESFRDHNAAEAFQESLFSPAAIVTPCRVLIEVQS